MQSIDLNIIPNGSTPICYASQFDNERKIRANLFEDLEPYTLTGNETVSFNARKPDKTVVTMALTNTADNYLIFETTEQLTAIYGDVLCDISISYDQELIATLNFILKVEIDPLYRGIQSESEIHNLEAQVNQMVEDAVAEQYDSNNVLFDTAPTLGHGVPYAVTSGGLWSWLCDLPLRAYPTASGSIATFDTSLALPLQDCTIEINAVQESGTPTPSSPKAIIGFTGANIRVVGSNLTDEQWELGTIDGTTGANVAGSSSLRTTNYIPIEPNTTYYFYIGGTGTGSTNPYLYDQNKQYIGRLGSYLRNQTFTTPSNAYYIRLGLQTGYGTTYNNDISINYPATDTAYHAYNPNSKIIPISWQDEVGIVYGGSLRIANGYTNIIDNKNYVDLGSLSWNNASDNLSSSSGIASDVKAPSANTQAFNGLCSCYEVAPRTGISDKQISVQTNGNIVISDTAIAGMTGEQIKAYVTGFILVYEVATPTEYTLASTPPITTLQGTNNVFTDTNGNTSVVYACSLKDYIDGQ